LCRQQFEGVIPLLERVRQQSLFNLLPERAIRARLCLVPEDGKQNEDRREPLLSVDEQELSDSFGTDCVGIVTIEPMK
jgi:hypothetical protein